LNIEPPAEDLFYVLGIPGTKAIAKYAASEAEGQKMLNLWTNYENDLFDLSHPFAGIEDSLQALKDAKLNLGIVTSRTDEELQVVYDNFDFEKYFDTAITTNKTKLHKPHPDPILAAIKELNVKPEDTVYIGDSIYDFQCARNAHVRFALAGWGAKDNPEFSKVDYYLANPDDLLNIIRN
jgi:haloacid dehalogenase superfamily, subfamily IA, variant 1 with third motif having Dx(3-4)D or Dx(3-4)E